MKGVIQKMKAIELGDHSKTGANCLLAMKVPSRFPLATDTDILCFEIIATEEGHEQRRPGPGGLPTPYVEYERCVKIRAVSNQTVFFIKRPGDSASYESMSHEPLEERMNQNKLLLEEGALIF